MVETGLGLLKALLQVFDPGADLPHLDDDLGWLLLLLGKLLADLVASSPEGFGISEYLAAAQVQGQDLVDGGIVVPFGKSGLYKVGVFSDQLEREHGLIVRFVRLVVSGQQ